MLYLQSLVSPHHHSQQGRMPLRPNLPGPVLYIAVARNQSLYHKHNYMEKIFKSPGIMPHLINQIPLHTRGYYFPATICFFFFAAVGLQDIEPSLKIPAFLSIQDCLSIKFILSIKCIWLWVDCEGNVRSIKAFSSLWRLGNILPSLRQPKTQLSTCPIALSMLLCDAFQVFHFYWCPVWFWTFYLFL